MIHLMTMLGVDVGLLLLLVGLVLISMPPVLMSHADDLDGSFTNEGTVAGLKMMP